MKSEARALGRWRSDPRLAIAVGGARPGAARAAAERLAAQGVRGFISFGLAGGLDPALRPGDPLRPRAVGDRLGQRIRAAAPAGGVAIKLLLHASQIVATAERKAALRVETGAAAVDMESWEVAGVAERRGLPLLILRAIADPAERALPPAALRATRPDGGLALGSVLASLATRPGQLPALLRLGRDAAAGTETLRRLAQSEIGPFLTAQALP